MKKIITVMLALAMCFSLCACGKSEAVTNVETLIATIGEVTVKSENAIIAAEDAYKALTEEEKAKVENYAVLLEARVVLDEAIKVAEDIARRKPYAGEWLYEIDGVKYLTLNTDGTAILNGQSSSWTLNEDKATISLSDGSTFSIVEEDGFTKIVADEADWYVRSIDYKKAFEKKFFMNVTLTSENVRDYLGDPVLAGYELDEWGEIEADGMFHFYFLTSKVYEDGWVYIGCSDDFAIEIVYHNEHISTHDFGPFDDITNMGRLYYPVQIGNRVKGTLSYVREECVEANYMTETNGMIAHTKLELKNGTVYETSNIHTQDGVSFDYQDFLH